MNKQQINLNILSSDQGVETAVFLSSSMNDVDLPISVLEKVAYQNEEILFVQKMPPQSYFPPFISLFLTLLLLIGFSLYVIIRMPSVSLFWVLMFLPLFFVIVFVFLYAFGREYSVLTNFRVMSLKKFSFRKSVTIKSIPLLAITEAKCPNPTTLQFWCGVQIGRKIPAVVFENLKTNDLRKIKEIVEQCRTKTNHVSLSPLTIYDQFNLSSLSSDYKTLADKYTPFLWAHKPSVWQFVKHSVIISVLLLVSAMFFSVVMSAYSSDWMFAIYFDSIFAGILILTLLIALALVASFNGWNAISEKHGVLLIRRGFFLIDTVIPWSKVYPLTSVIDLKNGSGSLTFYNQPLFDMNGPEVLAREEIIYHKFAEGKSEAVCQ